MWERFFNWQSDMDWTWGPFLALRPAPDMPILPWVWGRLFLALSLAGLILIALTGLVCVLEPQIAARQHWAVPPPLAETLATLTAMGSDPSTRWLLIGVGLSLPPLFFLACLPFHVAWNRRAARLRHALPPDTPLPRSDVWPPAPSGLSD